MNAFRSILEVVTTQQDFLWFCVLLAWLGAGALLALHRRNSALSVRRSWLVTVCFCGLLLAGGELVLHALPSELYNEERLGWDLYLNGLQTLQSLAALILLAKPAGRKPGLLLAGGALVLLWGARIWDYKLVDLLLLVAAALVAAFVPRAAGWRRLLWLLALAPFPATTGVCSEWLEHPRRWFDLSPLALPSTIWQLLAAGVLIQALGRETGWLPNASQGRRLLRELHGFLGAVLAWLVLGFGLAFWTGRIARASFEESLLRRVSLVAGMVDVRHVEPVVSPKFVLEGFRRGHQPWGDDINPVAHAPYLVEAARALRHDLVAIHRLNPDVSWPQFMTLRSGYLLTPAMPENLPPARKEVIAIDRRFLPLDLQAWADRRVLFEGPLITDYGDIVRVRAPVVTPDGRMLGWIAFEAGAVQWAAVQAVARLQTFALVGVGVGLALFISLLRAGRLAREQAEHEATLALESDRAKTAFLAKVSHELRTPIQSILGYGELLAGQSLEPESKRWLNSVRAQGQLLIRLVNDLIDLSALQAGAFRTSPQAASLAELVRGTTESLLPRATAKNLSLVAEVAPDIPPWLLFDPERVRQVLLNLVGNAIKFTDVGGVRVRLTSPAEPGVYEISVEDTGPGIAAEDMLRLFRPFTRLHEHDGVEGAGLGLALSAAICESLGGCLRAESDGRHGCRFIARLPLAITTAPAPVPTAMPPAELAGRRVLVADDNTLVRELFVTSLRQAGAWVDEAADGLEAVELCAQQAYATIVLDVSMPWLNGFEAARRIRAAAKGPLLIIGVSAHVGSADRALSAAAGMDQLLVKPLAIADLLGAVAGRVIADRPAPTAGSPDNLALLRRLRRQFLEEAPRLLGELEQAQAASDRRWLRARTHYLKNSSDVAGFPEISLLCAELERVTQDQQADPAPVVAEISRLLRLLHTSLSPETPSGINQPKSPPS